jgi:hypothetical protein
VYKHVVRGLRSTWDFLASDVDFLLPVIFEVYIYVYREYY